jgi:hypothetical protein
MLQAEADVFSDREVGEQRVILEHHTHAALLRGEDASAIGGDFTVDVDLPPIGVFESGDQAEQGRLSAPTGAKDGQDLSRVDLKINAVYSRGLSKFLT